MWWLGRCVTFRRKCYLLGVVVVSLVGLVWAKARGGGSSSSCEDDNVTKGPDPAYLEIEYGTANFLLFLSFAGIVGLSLVTMVGIHMARKHRKLSNIRDMANNEPLPMMWSTVVDS